MSERASTIAALVLLLLAGAAAWSFQQRAPLVPQPATLADLPYTLASFRGVDSPVGDNVEQMLRADFNVMRAYVAPFGQVVHLYVGYYGTRRGGTPEHTPQACYTAHGWEIVNEGRVVTDRNSGYGGVEYLVESHGQQQLVLFWYRSYRATGLGSTLALNVDHVIGNLSQGRADGALVRLSTPLTAIDRSAARHLLLSFARALEPELAKVWPAEEPGPARSAAN